MMKPFERMVAIFIKEDQPENFKGVAAFGGGAAHPFIRELFHKLQERKADFKQTEHNGKYLLFHINMFDKKHLKWG